MADKYIDMQKLLEKPFLRAEEKFSSSGYVPSLFHSDLRKMLDNDDEDGFRKRIEQEQKHNLHQLIHYNYFSGKSLLEMACFKGKSNFVKILLDFGAQINYINEILSRGPIHIASANGHHDVIEVLMAHEIQLNVHLETVNRGFTALYLAVKNQHIECVKTLLNIGANPNIPDYQGITPLHLAVKLGYHDIVDEIMTDREERDDIDIDSYYDILNKETTRELLLKEYPDKAFPQQAERAINFYDLRFYVCANKNDSFFENIDKITEIDDLNKLIVFCAKVNFSSGINELLKRKKTMACADGLPHEALTVVAGHRTCIYYAPDWEFYKKHLECFKFIVNQPDINVRWSSDYGWTPLLRFLFDDEYYSDEEIQRLLQLGSCIGHHNNMGYTPIDFLSPESLSKYFDSCVRSNFCDPTDNFHEDWKFIEFDYKCLQPLPMVSADSVNFLRRTTQKCRRFNQLEMEMKPLKILCDKAHMKHLLHHPLLTSFITLKRYRIRKYLYANILLNAIFCCLMACYIYFMASMDIKRFVGPINGTFDGTFEEKFLRNETRNGTIIGKFEGTTIAGFNGNISGSFDGTINKAINGTINGTIFGLFSGTTDGTLSLSVVNLVTYSLMYAIIGVLTVIFLILLAIRELIEFISIPLVYFQSIENWLEIFLIIGSASVIFGALNLDYSSFIFIFLASKIIEILQQFQTFSVSVQMLKVVLFHFLRNLVFNVVFIVAFALAFYTLFQNEDDNFKSVTSSLFKTIVMSTGEFDAGNIPFKKTSYSGEIIFVFFICFVVIILFNFFTGIVVFDMAKILKEAETIKLVSQVEQISYVEQLITSVSRISQMKYGLNFLSFIETRVFPDYVSAESGINVKIKGLKNFMVKNDMISLDDKTIESAKEILFKRNHISDGDQIKNELANYNQIVNDRIEEIKKNIAKYDQAVNNRIEEIKKNIKIELKGISFKKKTRKTI